MSEPKRYRKRPVVVEAMLLQAKTLDELVEWLDANDAIYKLGLDRLVINTLEGNMDAEYDRSFIIKGVQGEFYPCRRDIFEATYEAVND